MTAKAKFIRMLSTVPSREINFGSGGIRLYGREEIENGQVGYGVSLEGKSLRSDQAHGWKSNWLVIGYETGSGDPLTMDTAATDFPVFRDFNGQGSWSPVKIAISLNVFFHSLREFSTVAERRHTPVELDANPIGKAEITELLEKINSLNQNSIELDFWKALLEDS